MYYLSEKLDTKNNNFNLLRMLAAVAVIFSHSFILANGPDNGADPFSRIFGIPLSSLAVNIFFITSGLLVMKSLVERKELLFFLVARFLRIFPGLLVAVLFSSLFIGLIFSELSLSDFLSHPDTFSFIKRNIWLFDNVIQYSLPGVFNNLPYKYAVNGSLWTLPWEVYSYSIIFFVYLFFRKSQKTVNLLILTFLIFLNVNNAYEIFEIELINPVYLKLLTMFYIGVSFYIFRYYIVISFRVLLVIFLLHYLVKDLVIYKITFPFLIAYSVLCFSYLIEGRILQYNKFGDYSYGAYIYAFPIQQALVSYYSPSGYTLFILSLLFTLPVAWLSWTTVERPSLQYRYRLMEAISSYFSKMRNLIK